MASGSNSKGNLRGSKGDKGDRGHQHQRRDYSDHTCFRCGKKGHIRCHCPDIPKARGSNSSKPEVKPDMNVSKADLSVSEADAGTAKKSGSLYTAMAHAAMAKHSTTYYIDSGASDHLILMKDRLCGYRNFIEPIEIAAADSGKVYTYSSGVLHVMTGQSRQAMLEDVYYTLKIHVWLLSLGKLDSQGWDIGFKQGSIELKDWSGDVFANVPKVKNIYLVELEMIPCGTSLVTWREDTTLDLTEDALMDYLQHVVMSATARGGNGREVSLLTWHHRLGHCSFKTVVDLAQGGVSGIVISDLPVNIPGLNTCAACVAAKSVHLLHKEGRSRATEYLEHIHINIASPMPLLSAGGKEYLYILVDNCT